MQGARQFFLFPQLWYTVLVAVAIVASFVFVSSRFISIAKNAEDELTNVRVGSIQDAFAPLARQLYDQPSTLRGYMQEIRVLNPTIYEFSIVTPASDGWRVYLSADQQFESNAFRGHDFLLNLAKGDPTHSYTVQEMEGTDRYFRTARAFLDASSSLMGIAVTRQTLSQADRQIAASIQTGVVTLIFILAALLLLFFRHARIIDYAVLYRKLQEIDQLKDDFIAMASHELRTPLTAIRGYAELLRDGSVKTAPERSQALERIELSAQALAGLINDMLDVSKIEQGRMTFEMKDIDPSTVIQDVCKMLQPVAEKKGLALRTSIASTLMRFDPERLRQIALNLVGNAVKYTEHGEVFVRASVLDGAYVIRVSDTGLGMSSDTRDHLFEKFYRAPGENVRKQTGTGLGLWITKQLIEKMDGTISVESIEGVGSHFIITFPRKN